MIWRCWAIVRRGNRIVFRIGINLGDIIIEGDFIPWFGDQLFAGNSLIGARREV